MFFTKLSAHSAAQYVHGCHKQSFHIQELVNVISDFFRELIQKGVSRVQIDLHPPARNRLLHPVAVTGMR